MDVQIHYLHKPNGCTLLLIHLRMERSSVGSAVFNPDECVVEAAQPATSTPFKTPVENYVYGLS